MPNTPDEPAPNRQQMADTLAMIRADADPDVVAGLNGLAWVAQGMLELLGDCPHPPAQRYAFRLVEDPSDAVLVICKSCGKQVGGNWS